MLATGTSDLLHLRDVPGVDLDFAVDAFEYDEHGFAPFDLNSESIALIDAAEMALHAR
jgi:hypothetical protein